MLPIIGRNVIGHTDFTCVQIRSPVDICYHYLGDIVTLRIHLYCLHSILLADFSSCVITIFEFQGLHIASPNRNCLVIALYLSLFHCVTYSLVMLIFLCEQLTVNPF